VENIPKKMKYLKRYPAPARYRNAEIGGGRGRKTTMSFVLGIFGSRLVLSMQQTGA
jgi:hypothetical protein